MTGRQDEGSSRAALLKNEDTSPRESIDENETDALVGREGTSEGKGPIVRAYDKKKSTGLWTIHWPTRSCLIIIGILSTGLIGVIAASGWFVYKVKPPDGQSPPCMNVSTANNYSDALA